MATPAPRLGGDGLILRAVTSHDVADVVSISAYDGRPARDEADAAAMLERIDADVARGESVHWGICLEGTDRVVGTVGFYRGFTDGVGEVGYVLHEAQRGKGVMTRALRLVVAYAFDALGLRAVVAWSDPNNVASHAVLRRCGFVLADGEDEGRFRFELVAPDATGVVGGPAARAER